MRSFCCLLLCLVAGLAGAQGFVVRGFSAEIALQKDGTLDVVENIQVVFTEDRHGIFRFIPTALDNGRGATRSIFISGVTSADASGKADHVAISEEGGTMRIRIGDADVELPAGTQRLYSLKYHVQNAINWLDHDESWQPAAELYWNATGNEWETTLENPKVRVTFPAVANDKDVRARIFRGVYGSKNSVTLGAAGLPSAGGPDLSLNLTKDTASAASQQALQPGEGMTVVVDLPANAIEKPSLAQQIIWFALPNLGFGIPLIALVFALVAYVKYGKDPSGGPMVVQFDPPDDLSGSEVGAFIDERVDQRDIAAGIVSLAVKGYVTISARETGLVFKHTTAAVSLTGKPHGPDLTIFEDRLLTLFQGCGVDITEAEMQKHVAPEIGNLQKAIYTALVDRGYYHASPATVRTTYAFLGIFVLIALGFLTSALSPLKNPIPAMVGCGLSIPILVWGSMQSPRRTAAGAAALSRVKGFEEFMRRARSPELEWLSKKEPDQALFEKYLPHAIALGLVGQWAQAFEGIMIQAPTWYVGPYGVFSPNLFAHDMTSISSSLGSAASTPPRSSGASGGGSGFSSGGGFSGGGFGGGGGGSW